MSDRESSGSASPAQPPSRLSNALSILILAGIKDAACRKFKCEPELVSARLKRAAAAGISTLDIEGSLRSCSSLSEWEDMIDAWVGVEETRGAA